MVTNIAYNPVQKAFALNALSRKIKPNTIIQSNNKQKVPLLNANTKSKTSEEEEVVPADAEWAADWEELKKRGKKYDDCLKEEKEACYADKGYGLNPDICEEYAYKICSPKYGNRKRLKGYDEKKVK